MVEYFTPDYDKLIKIADPDDSKLQEFYEQNKRQYIALEKRKANLLLLTRDEALSRITVTDEEIKAAYEAAKESYNIPEKRRISQLTFPDKAAADKAYAELSKAKNFEETAAKLGFPAADIDLGLLTRPEMIDPKIAEAAFALKKNELSRPVEGQFSVALLRVTEIQGGKQRTLRRGQGRDQGSHCQRARRPEAAGAARRGRNRPRQGKPLKEIGEQLKLPFREIAEITRLGKTRRRQDRHRARGCRPHRGGDLRGEPGRRDGGPGARRRRLCLVRRGLDHAGAAKNARRGQGGGAGQLHRGREAQGDGSLCRPSRPSASRPAKHGEARQGAGRQGRAHGPLQALGNAARPAGGRRAAGLRLAKGAATSVPTPDGKSRIILRVADVIAAPADARSRPKPSRPSSTKQVRIDLLEQYVGGLRTRYGYTINEAQLKQALGPQTEQPQDTSDD